MPKRRSARPNGRRAPRRGARTKAVGPVTLAQAKALARVTTPAAAAGPADTSPAAVGRERKKLAQRQEAERRRRIREYTATLRIMKTQGAAGIDGSPLQIFAEGDSWFEYPVPFFGGGIIDRLAKRLGVPILNLATAGDEVRYMLGVRDRQLIAQQFRDGCPAGGPWHAMLFSGGGNDIVDNPMALWVREYDPSLPPARQIHQPRYDAALALVRAGYEDLIALRDELSPATHLFFQAYDFAIPDGRGVCNLGPWLKPAFDLRGFPDLAQRQAVTRVLLEQFARMVGGLTREHSRVTLIATQGTLPSRVESWHNELHPAKDGFNAFAVIFHAALRAVFPTRVLPERPPRPASSR